MSGSNTITVMGPTVLIVDGDFKLTGQAELNIVGTESYFQMYVGEDLDLTGPGVFNDEQNPEAFQDLGAVASGAGQSIKVAFQYDLNLKNLDSDGSYAISRRCELCGNSEWLDFSNTTILPNPISPL